MKPEKGNEPNKGVEIIVKGFTSKIPLLTLRFILSFINSLQFF